MIVGNAELALGLAVPVEAQRVFSGIYSVSVVH